MFPTTRSRRKCTRGSLALACGATAAYGRDETTLGVTAEALGVDRTGFEMEALVAASTAALTVYDMLKAVDKSIRITDLRLLSKSGGKSGDWAAPGA